MFVDFIRTFPLKAGLVRQCVPRRGTIQKRRFRGPTFVGGNGEPYIGPTRVGPSTSPNIKNPAVCGVFYVRRFHSNLPAKSGIGSPMRSTKGTIQKCRFRKPTF